MVIDDRRICTKVMMPGDLVSVLINGVYQECLIINRFNHDIYEPIKISAQPQTKAKKNQARLKQLRGRAGRWA